MSDFIKAHSVEAKLTPILKLHQDRLRNLEVNFHRMFLEHALLT
jgi:hypothetical protein